MLGKRQLVKQNGPIGKPQIYISTAVYITNVYIYIYYNQNHTYIYIYTAGKKVYTAKKILDKGIESSL